MSAAGDAPEADNPFSTRHVRPGAISYFFPPHQDLEVLLAKLQQHDWRGQIVGPHGSGKSTLLAALVPRLEQAGRRPLCVTLHDGQRRLPSDLARQADLDRATIVIVDGYGQLSRASRWRLRYFCRRRGLGLLISSHVDAGLPELLRTTSDPDLACRIVVHLLGPRGGAVSAEDVAHSFARHRGNLREVLMELYDVYETRREDGPS